MKTKNLDNIAVLKTIGAFLVIFIHISASVLVEVKKLDFFLFYDVLNQFSMCAVPLFIFASGLLLFHSYKNRELICLNFIKRRFTKILIPYIIWSSIYYALFVIANVYTFDIVFYFKNLLTGNHLYHLYFVIIILQFYLLFPIILKISQKYSYKLVLPLCLVLQLAFYKLPYFVYKDRVFLSYIFFFILGSYVSKHLEEFESFILKQKYLIITLFIIIGTVNSYYKYQLLINANTLTSLDIIDRFTIFGTIGIIFYYLISIYIARFRLKKIFLKISSGSFYIYLSHPLAILLIDYFCRNSLTIGIVEKSVISLILILLIVIPLSIIYPKIKRHFI